MEAADAAGKSAVRPILRLEHHRRDGQRDRDTRDTAERITEDGVQASGGGGGEVVLR